MKRSASDMSVEDAATVKRKCFLKEKDSYSLSDKNIVYASREQAEANFIIRSTEEVNFKAFGLSGIENVKRAFYTMLALLERNRELFASKSKYGAKELVSLLNSMSTEDRAEIEKLDNPSDVWEMLMVNDRARAQVTTSRVPQLSLLKLSENEDGERDIQTGIYLYATELVRLIKYLNTTHEISASVQGKYAPLPQLSDADLLC